MIIACVGQANVGKSTLFNRLTKSSQALVANVGELTRDRRYGNCVYRGKQLLFIDTGGWSAKPASVLAQDINTQTMAAVAEADLVLLIVDGACGVTSAEQILVEQLRKLESRIILVINKIDTPQCSNAMAECASLGVSPMLGVSAARGKGITDLLELLFTYTDKHAPHIAAASVTATDHVNLPDAVNFVVLGRPNVGKSTLVNSLLQAERMIVSAQPGTTRDSITSKFLHDGQAYTVTDTAGIRSRYYTYDLSEKLAANASYKAITTAAVVVLVIDGHEGITAQDLQLLRMAHTSGRPTIIGVNKTDLLDQHALSLLQQHLAYKLHFMPNCRIVYTSALKQHNIGALLSNIVSSYNTTQQTTNTAQLNRILKIALTQHKPPMLGNASIKLHYVHLGRTHPPLLVIHGDRVSQLPRSYQQYLAKVYQRELGWEAKIAIKFKENRK